MKGVAVEADDGGISRQLRRLGDRLIARYRSPEGAPLAALSALVVVGVGLRLLLVYAWRPAFLGFPDSSVYLEAAGGKFGHAADTVFFDTMRPAGYPIALRLLHPISDHLSFVILLQHGLGIGTAILLFLAVRHVGVPHWFALAPAAIVLLGGAEIYVEHAALTEALYIFLTAGALYAAVRSVDSRSPEWAALAGALIGAAADVRFLGVVIVPTLVIWLFVARRGSLRLKALHSGIALLFASLLVGAYVYAQNQATGITGLTRAGMWNTYARVAQFADCSRFTPPAGTEVLCETRLPKDRPGANEYMFGASPAAAAFGYPDYGGYKLSPVEDNKKIAAFTRAVILHQPLDYAKAIARDAVRYVDPEANRRPYDGLSAEAFRTVLREEQYLAFVMRDVVPLYYADRGYTVHTGTLEALDSYERHTRIQGVLIVALVLPALVGPFLTQGRTRMGAVLFVIVALELYLTPIVLNSYDFRYAIPGYGVLGSAAAVGAWASWTRLTPLRARLRQPAGLA